MLRTETELNVRLAQDVVRGMLLMRECIADEAFCHIGDGNEHRAPSEEPRARKSVSSTHAWMRRTGARNPTSGRRRSIRLRGYDYSSSGAYFVTICVRHRECLFGEIMDATIRLSEAGKIIQAVWDALPSLHSDIDLDVFIVMPNHIQGIILLIDKSIVGAGLGDCLRISGGDLHLRRIEMPDDATAEQTLNILVIDDEANIRKTLSLCLESEGHRVVAVSNFHDALAEASRRSLDVAFVDLRLGTADGMDLIPRLITSTPWLKIIVITAYSSIETAVEAMRRGAADYIPKPFTPAQVKMAVNKVSEVRSLEQRLAHLQEELGRSQPEIDFSSTNLAMQRVVYLARQVASTDATVLLRGESGTGKTVLARQIHYWSSRASKPLGVISCPTLSPELMESELFGHVKGAFTGAIRDNPGRIAASEGGTLLLDEISELPLLVQPKLLRFLQEREYERMGDNKVRKANVRIISATNVDLEQAVQTGRFRDDLLYRLNVIQIEIPPLRERLEDVVPLAELLLAFFGRKYHRPFIGFTEEAQKALKQYSWPGNVRELRNAIERTAILCKSDHVGLEYVPGKTISYNAFPDIGDAVSLAIIEEEHIRRVLARSKSLQEAADTLGIDQATLWRRRKHYRI